MKVAIVVADSFLNKNFIFVIWFLEEEILVWGSRAL